jgi:DNA-binding CsgD family transcriptional regulator
VLLARLDTLRCLQVGPGRSASAIDTPKAGTGCGAVASKPLLSARELQVARLVSLGMTNKQVAIQLTLSPNTIKRHVARILRRLGLCKRSAMAAWYATTNQSGPGTVAPAVGTPLPWRSTPARMSAHVMVDPLRAATATLQQ